jgi:hypothetical protein
MAALACGVIVAGQEGPPIPGRWAETLPLNRFHRGWNRTDVIKVTPTQATEMQRLADRIVSTYGGTPQEASERDPDVLAMRRAVYDSLDWSAVRAVVGK